MSAVVDTNSTVVAKVIDLIDYLESYKVGNPSVSELASIRNSVISRCDDIVNLFPVTGYGTLSNFDKLLFVQALTYSTIYQTHGDSELGDLTIGSARLVYHSTTGVKDDDGVLGGDSFKDHNTARSIVFCEEVMRRAGFDSVTPHIPRTDEVQHLIPMYRMAIHNPGVMPFLRHGFDDFGQIVKFIDAGIDVDFATSLTTSA